MEQSVVASCHKHRRTTLERIEKYISHNQFKDVNLRSRLFPAAKVVDRLLHWAVPGSRGSWEEWPFRKVVTQDFQPVAAGQSFGPLWSTHWFRVEVDVPASWAGEEVWLHWVSQAEALLWTKDGEPMQGFSPGGRHLSPLQGATCTGDSEPDQSRTDYLLHKRWDGLVHTLVLYVEMACCGMFGGGKDGMISPSDKDRTFAVEAVEVSTRDRKVFKLLTDLEVLHDLASTLPLEDPRGHQALHTANHIVNAIVKDNLREASELADSFFAKGNGGLAHTLALIGNCHIDTAWLWPYSETKRKCARSWSSTLALMEEYPELKFACSQAQQLSWVKTHYPGLFERIRQQVDEGRFIPVGGTWVEMDGLIPSGESFMRQFLYGQQFFMKEFGVKCQEFWLPDTFGYSAQFPQICKHFGISRFLTQKLSWSLLNKFPHHNFLWEGLDGSTILAHFPPGDSYELRVRVKEALHTVTNLQDKGRVSTSAFLYGHGDGGGGPTRPMLERSRRLRDVDGCPKMEHMSPSDFFDRLESERHNLCRWVGELYLELHNGTYTSQAKTKRQNRACEWALRDAELLLAVASLMRVIQKKDTLERQAQLGEAWRKVLLNQFHDVIPGTSIGAVYEDSDRLYQEAMDAAEGVRSYCCNLLFKGEGREGLMALNTFPWEVTEVVVVDEDHLLEIDVQEQPCEKAGRLQDKFIQSTGQVGKYYVAVVAPGIGWSRQFMPLMNPPVTVSLENNVFKLANDFIKAEINMEGQVKSLSLNGDTRDIFKRFKVVGKAEEPLEGSLRWSTKGRGNQVVLFDDIPLYWDAWDVMDYHLETGKVLNEGESGHVDQKVELVESGPLMAKLKWTLKISERSTLVQEISLSATSSYLEFKCHVNWNENRKCLKVAFDTALVARIASFDTQFGFVERPTHTNTSWDAAKFEVCGHKWADLSEPNLGIAVLSDCKYGWTARGGMLMLSLLRSPKAPDAECDMGTHTFAYALMPHRGSGDRAKVQQRAYEFNKPLSVFPTTSDIVRKMFFSLEGDGAMIEAVKLAEDGSGDVVVRVHETLGNSTRVKLRLPDELKLKEVFLCDGLEEPVEQVPLEKPAKNYSAYPELSLSPFKIVTVRLCYSSKSNVLPS